MGNTYTSLCTLTEAQLLQYSSTSHFSIEEVKALSVHFKKMSAAQNVMNRKQFQAAMLFKDSALLDIIFRVFDADDDSFISFDEYLNCLSIISTKSSKEDKLKFSFQIYDFDGDGFISVTDLTAVLAATLREHKIVILRAEIDQMVQITMTEAKTKHPNMISFDEYKVLVAAKPHLLAQLTINISSLISQYTRNNVVALNTPRGFASALNLHDTLIHGRS